MDLKQHLLSRKRFFDEKVQQYKGSDPLKLRCEFFSWLENYSKEDIADIYFPLLEETLNLFVEDPVYKQDTRYVRMWLTYSATQPNPLEVIKNMHSRGLGTECAMLYTTWAEQLIKNGSFLNADAVFKMGLNGNIQPKAELQEQYDKFLIDVGRRTLMEKIQCPKCGNSFQIGVPSGPNGNPSTSTEPIEILDWKWNPLKVGDVDDFNCPIAYFEDPDPTKIRMYPKEKVYPGNGQEFSLEELLAEEYEIKYREEERAALARAKEEEEAKKLKEEEEARKQQEELRKREAEKLTSMKSVNPLVQASIPVIPKLLSLPKRPRDSPGVTAASSKRAPGFLPNTLWPQDIDNSANSTTFTVHTKEAMNVIQDMWSSPVPSQVATRHFQNDKPPESNQAPITTPKPAPFEIYTEDPAPVSRQSQKTPFQIYDENINAISRKSTRSVQKPRLLDNDDNENAPPGQEIMLTSKQASVLKPKAAIEVYNDTQDFKAPDANLKRAESLPKRQLFKDDGGAELAQKLESQARIQPPMFDVQDKNDDFSDITCNTKAFEFILPSSTPLATNKVLKPLSSVQRPDEIHKTAEPTNLSVILEQSKDKSGNSSASSLASHTTKSSRSGPLYHSDAKSSEDMLFPKMVYPSVSAYRPSSTYPITFLNPISEEESLALTDRSSHSLAKVSLSACDQTHYGCINKTYSIEVSLNETENILSTSFKSSCQKLKSKTESFLLNQFSIDQENLYPGMLGFPSRHLHDTAPNNVPLRRSSRKKPLASAQDKENLNYAMNNPHFAVKSCVEDYEHLKNNSSAVENSVRKLRGKNNVRKLSLCKIPLTDSHQFLSKTRSLSIDTAETQIQSDRATNIYNSMPSTTNSQNILPQKEFKYNYDEILSNTVLKTTVKQGKLMNVLENKTNSSLHVFKRRGRPPKNLKKVNLDKNANLKETGIVNSKVVGIKNESVSNVIVEKCESYESPIVVKIKKKGRATMSSKNTESHENPSAFSKLVEPSSRRMRKTIDVYSPSKETNLYSRHSKNIKNNSSLLLCNLERKDNFIDKCQIGKPKVKAIGAERFSCITDSFSFSPQRKIKKIVKKRVPFAHNEKPNDSKSVPETFDPFNSEVIESLLEKIGFPKSQHLPNYYTKQANLPTGTKSMKLGDETFSIQGEIGRGAYAKVLKAANSSGNTVALKIEKPACKWEYYIAKEIQSRVNPKYAAAFMDISAAYIYNNGSILETPYAKYGTLTSCINITKEKTGKLLDLGLILHFSLELIEIVEHLHKCKIIHADLKPDNVVLRELPSYNEALPCLQLIDFGRCLDMSLFPPDTKFYTTFKTEDNKCIEMKENKPWTYQIDLQGLASLFYVLLFGEYMKVQKKNNKWQLQQLIPRNVRREIWNPIFDSLLNVNPATDLPFNFNPMKEALLEAFRGSLSNNLLQIKVFGNNIAGK